MRYVLFAAANVLFAVALAPQVSLAAANVLLPKDSGNDQASFPNLGLSPSVPAPAVDQTKDSVSPSPDIKDAPDGAKTGAPAPSSDSPRIIQQTDPSITPSNSTLPNSLTISFGNKSSFGADDFALIGKKLGLSHKQISSSCALSLHGLLKTDKGSYVIGGGMSPQTVVAYDGTIKSAIMSAQALCLASGNLPPGDGVMIKMNDRFVVPLQSIGCSVPDFKASSLVITYDGSGKSQCVYK